MKVALFSRSVYPRTGGSSFVTEELAANLTKEELFVIGGKDIFFSSPFIRSASFPRFYYLPSQLSLKGRGERFLEFFRYLLFPLNLIQVIRIMKRENPDAVVSVFPDAYFCILALISSRLMGKPYFTYFHNTYKENRTGFSRWSAGKIQSILFRASRLIFVMSDGLKAFYERSYPGVTKFRTLPHTFREWPGRSPQETPFSAAQCNLAFTGNFNDSNIEATIRVVNALKKFSHIRMNFYTPVPKALLKLRGLDVSAINYIGYLAREDYRTTLAKNDVMVLTHGFTGGYSSVEYETIFPTRVIELLLSGKPIFAHAPASSYVAEYLIRHDCATVVTDADEEILQHELLSLLENKEKRERQVRNGGQCLSAFYGPNVVKMWTNEIQGALRT